MPKKTTPKKYLELLYTIVCDDVRREDNGKFIIIGLYPENIMVSEIPAKIAVTIWFHFNAEIYEPLSLQIQVKGKILEKEEVFDIVIEDEKMYGKKIGMPISISPVILSAKEAGEISIRYKEKSSSKWKVARKLKIKTNG